MYETPSDPPRERRHQKVHRRILEAATEVIVTSGFDALSMNKLAASLDYTPGALYRYVPSKDALIASLVAEVVSEVGARITAAASALPADAPLARVVACARAWRAFSEDDPHRFALVAMMLAAPRVVMQDEAHVTPAIAAMIEAVRPLARALSDAERAGLLGPAPRLAAAEHDRALVLFAALQGVLLLRKQAQRAPALVDLDRLFALACKTLLAGWGASDAALDPLFPAEPTR
ncbi:MAG: TetR/AcrR family transcriptional regulator [Deltaproteobacteria bacterium]|nr:TetR/AcrR family transcriptional regulator [Deltaproteobacteria bacterium]